MTADVRVEDTLLGAVVDALLAGHVVDRRRGGPALTEDVERNAGGIGHRQIRAHLDPAALTRGKTGVAGRDGTLQLAADVRHVDGVDEALPMDLIAVVDGIALAEVAVDLPFELATRGVEVTVETQHSLVKIRFAARVVLRQVTVRAREAERLHAQTRERVPRLLRQ
jgi:hypothetical protein